MRLIYSLAGLVWVTLLAGCGAATTKVDTGSLSSAFGAASADQQAQVSTIVGAVDSNDYEAALGSLKTLISGKLSSEQRTALTTFLADMQRVVVENQDKFSMDVYNGLSELVGELAGNPKLGP